MKSIKYCIFDFDGTVADSQWFWQTVTLRILQSRGCPATEEDFEVSYTLNNSDRWDLYSRRFGLTEEDKPSPEEIHERIGEFYRTDVTWKEGAVEFLTWLRERGVKTALFSASPRSILVHGVETLKAEQYFDYIFSTTDFGVGKGKAEGYRACLNAMGATAEETVMFEDAAYSLKGAKDAGIYVVAVHERCKIFEIDEIRSLCDRYVYDLRECMEGLL